MYQAVGTFDIGLYLGLEKISTYPKWRQVRGCRFIIKGRRSRWVNGIRVMRLPVRFHRDRCRSLLAGTSFIYCHGPGVICSVPPNPTIEIKNNSDVQLDFETDEFTTPLSYIVKAGEPFIYHLALGEVTNHGDYMLGIIKYKQYGNIPTEVDVEYTYAGAVVTCNGGLAPQSVYCAVVYNKL